MTHLPSFSDPNGFQHAAPRRSETRSRSQSQEVLDTDGDSIVLKLFVCVSLVKFSEERQGSPRPPSSISDLDLDRQNEVQATDDSRSGSLSLSDVESRGRAPSVPGDEINEEGKCEVSEPCRPTEADTVLYCSSDRYQRRCGDGGHCSDPGRRQDTHVVIFENGVTDL